MRFRYQHCAFLQHLTVCFACSLGDEEEQWLKLKNTAEMDMQFACSSATIEASSAGLEPDNGVTQEKPDIDAILQQEKLSCRLEVTQGVDALQRSALQQLGSTTEQVLCISHDMFAPASHTRSH